MNVEQVILDAIGDPPTRIEALAGGCVGEVYRADFAGGESLVAKVDRSAAGTLDVEGYMLEFLAPHLPVPKVVHAGPDLLLMEWLDGASSFSTRAEERAGELLASLHGVAAPEFGLERDTLIGGLHQPNTREGSWLEFFARHRLSAMAAQAHAHGRLSTALRTRVDALAADLPQLVGEPPVPALLHGDVWSGNVLARGDRITGFLDPAIYFGHPEVELAFITMFSTFGAAFFAAYEAQRPLDPGFMKERRHIYNLYPYLVHVRLFGGSYVASVERVLARFGY